ncbi:imidazoleglycerol-phosphate dehydratase HisB [Thermanaerothrix sp. 4228-RoL]|uniref:Imidazoleglycerol-phosphate dehydratase n=1 Tax=Thermanaerothrix solaris TaxID=3058434 RepID=A0ABU3NNL0_9CHLR|nr:imidazoleglycerol-phosphate dehydratase HisB [Thermanaerothrix sp. 4228-RoL]MDT8898434.1 imidazoleglycerol-phosphate dehydratase HisB [Thermanaerothrix sp. 4228-RoL]
MTLNPLEPLPRRAEVRRETAETRIRVALNLDGRGQHRIQTGLGFLDHMLAQVAYHGLFDLDIEAQGDLHIDVHHTLEDVALTLGDAFDRALGERAGLTRMGFFYAPLDESLARVVVDFSGRPYAVVQVRWHAPLLGNIPTSLFAHFLESFAQRARCALHARVFYGRDDHHQAEALFKALGRALCAATRLEPRRQGEIPSTKGALDV